MRTTLIEYGRSGKDLTKKKIKDFFFHFFFFSLHPSQTYRIPSMLLILIVSVSYYYEEFFLKHWHMYLCHSEYSSFRNSSWLPPTPKGQENWPPEADIFASIMNFSLLYLQKIQVDSYYYTIFHPNWLTLLLHSIHNSRKAAWIEA